MTCDRLEQWQVGIYLLALAVGLGLGSALPGLGGVLERLIWPALALLLYATFCQMPLGGLREALADRRFLAAAVSGNFLALPLLVWGLSWFAPADPAIRLGLLLVLLVPCTDWFISFARQGGGDTRRALAFAPLSLLLQIVLLPGYLWLMFDPGAALALPVTPLLLAFLGLILLPLLLAWLTRCAASGQVGEPWLERLARAPVPLLALVILLVAASQVETVRGELIALTGVAWLFFAYLLVAATLAVLWSRLFALPPRQSRVLLFSFGTRNSFVVLPLALALPAGWEAAALVVVLQSLIELLGMIGYLWWVKD